MEDIEEQIKKSIAYDRAIEEKATEILQSFGDGESLIAIDLVCQKVMEIAKRNCTVTISWPLI